MVENSSSAPKCGQYSSICDDVMFFMFLLSRIIIFLLLKSTHTKIELFFVRSPSVTMSKKHFIVNDDDKSVCCILYKNTQNIQMVSNVNTLSLA